MLWEEWSGCETGVQVLVVLVVLVEERVDAGLEFGQEEGRTKAHGQGLERVQAVVQGQAEGQGQVEVLEQGQPHVGEDRRQAVK